MPCQKHEGRGVTWMVVVYEMMRLLLMAAVSPLADAVNVNVPAVLIRHPAKVATPEEALVGF